MRPSCPLCFQLCFAVALVLAISAPVLAGPPPPTAEIFRAYPPPGIDLVLAIGDFAADPGLELVGKSASGLELVVVSLSTGVTLGDFSLLPDPRDWQPINPHTPDAVVHILVRDVDHDGYGELLLYQQDSQRSITSLGLYGFSGGSTLSELWYFDQG